jgi:hypothetical protein
MPDPTRCEPVFVGIHSSRRHTTGYVCYVGHDVTAADIIAAAGLTAADELVSMLDDFLEQVRQFRIDNVIAIDWQDGRVVLTKVADHTVRPPRRRLP